MATRAATNPTASVTGDESLEPRHRRALSPVAVDESCATVPRLSNDVSPGCDAFDRGVSPDHGEQLLIFCELSGVRAAARDIEFRDIDRRTGRAICIQSSR